MPGQPQKVLITGGAGFIGRNLSRHLVERGDEVIIVDKMSTQIHGDDSPRQALGEVFDHVRFIEGDVLDESLLASVIPEVDQIVHLASETGTGQSMYEVRQYAESNITGCASLLQVLQQVSHHVSKLVLTSSRAIYGEGKYRADNSVIHYPGPRLRENIRQGVFHHLDSLAGAALTALPTDELSPANPVSVYGASKHTQEQFVRLVCDGMDIPVVILRLQNVYGPGQSLANPYTGILSIFANLAANNKPIKVFEDGEESRDFVYISDVVHAISLALGLDNQADNLFNVGSGRAVSIARVAAGLIQALESSSTVEVTGEFRIGDIRHSIADLSRAEGVLGYRSQVPFDEGLNKFVRWLATQYLPELDLAGSIRDLKKHGLMDKGQ
jgi:dTDP-L-rhamnose 4-epimerase